MTQNEHDVKSALPTANITDSDVDLMVESYAKAHPELADTGQTRALREALSEMEHRIKEPVIQQKQAAQRLTSIAATLSGGTALGLVAAAAAPQLLGLTIVAAVVGLIVSSFVVRKADMASEEATKD